MGKIPTPIKFDRYGWTLMLGAQRYAKGPLYAIAFGLGLTIWFLLLRNSVFPPAPPIGASDHATHLAVHAARRTAASPKTAVTPNRPRDLRPMETPSGESTDRVRPVPDILRDATLIVRAPAAGTDSTYSSRKPAKRAARPGIQARPNEAISIRAQPHETNSMRAQRSAPASTRMSSTSVEEESLSRRVGTSAQPSGDPARAQYDPATAGHKAPSSPAVTVIPAPHPAGLIGQQTMEQMETRIGGTSGSAPSGAASDPHSVGNGAAGGGGGKVGGGNSSGSAAADSDWSRGDQGRDRH
jgi:hypothetical protein